MNCSMPGFPVLHYLLGFLRFTFIESVMLSNRLIPYHSLLLLPSVFPSIRDFSNESAVRIRWPKHWSFSFSISPSNEYSGLISLKINWLDLLALRDFQLSSLAPQFEGINSLTFCLLYGTALITIPDHWEDHSLDFTDLSWQSSVSAFQHTVIFVITFLPRSNHLLISWVQSPSAVILESKKRKSVITSTFLPSICHEVMEPDAIILVWVFFFF